MLNLYKLLNISPNATPAEIQAAMKKAAQSKSASLETLQKTKQYLLNEEMRKKYNAKLFAEHPEILQEMMSPQSVEQAKPKQVQPQPTRRQVKRHIQVSPYIEATLTKNETVLYVGKVTWWSQMVWIILGLILLPFLIGIIPLIVVVINVISTELALTDKRIIAKFGFIRREAVELNLSRIESIIIQQGIIGRILNYGSIIIRGTGGGNAPIPYIDNPLAFKKAVSEVLDASE